MKTVYTAADLKKGRTYRGHKILAMATWCGGPIMGTPGGNDKVHYTKGHYEDICTVDAFLRMVN